MEHLPQQSLSPIAEAPGQADVMLALLQAQNEELALLREQNLKLDALVQRLAATQSPNGHLHIKVEDFNMPFWAMVGLWLKATFSSIPAGLMVGALLFGLTLMVGFFCGGVASLPLFMR